MHVLVVGAGSIGTRHIKNLQALGAQVTAVDNDRDRLAGVQGKYRDVFLSLDDALAHGPYDGAIVAVPTNLHIPTAVTLITAGINPFVEKPLGTIHDTGQILRLNPLMGHAWIMVGYSMRYSKPVETIYRLLSEYRIGDILHISASVGQYLPDWHPLDDYRLSYMVDHQRGGGALQDLSHEIDYVQMLCGRISTVSANIGTVDTLPMDADNLTDMMVMFENEIGGYIHMDVLSRDYHRTCRIIGDKGTISWDYSSGVVRLYDAAKHDWEAFDVQEGWNAQYLSEMQDYLVCLEKNIAPECGYRQALETMNVIWAAADSQRTGEWVKVRYA